MESVQCVRNEEISVQLSVEEKASVDEIVKQAELSLESQELLDQSIGVVAKNESLDKAAIATQIQVLVGALMNQTKGPLTVMASKIYAGHIVKNFPNPLKGSTGSFSMTSTPNKGIKAYVVYSGKNKAGVECAWLLAFADTKATGRRIYVKCGPKSKFININSADVEHNLDNSRLPWQICYHDKETGTSICATIRGSHGKSVVGAAYFG